MLGKTVPEYGLRSFNSGRHSCKTQESTRIQDHILDDILVKDLLRCLKGCYRLVRLYKLEKMTIILS